MKASARWERRLPRIQSQSWSAGRFVCANVKKRRGAEVACPQAGVPERSGRWRRGGLAGLVTDREADCANVSIRDKRNDLGVDRFNNNKFEGKWQLEDMGTWPWCRECSIESGAVNVRGSMQAMGSLPRRPRVLALLASLEIARG